MSAVLKRNYTPASVVSKVEKEYPRIWDILSIFLKDRFQEKANHIIKQVFLPMYIYDVILETPDGWKWKKTPHKECYNAQEQAVILSALCPWYYTQAVYEFDMDFFAQLVGTPNDSVIPWEVFERFPNYSIYIKFVGTDFLQQYDENSEAKCCGMWVSCSLGEKDHDTMGFSFVTHLVDVETGQVMLHPFTLPLKRGMTIPESIREMCKELKMNPIEEDDGEFMSHENWTSRLVNALLYLCSNEPDVVDKTPGVKDRSFRLLSGITKSGKFQLFPAQKQKVFSVGSIIAKKLQEHEQATNRFSTNPIRPHVRRAHWHGYWTGPIKGDRNYILKWIPPTLVGVHNGYQENR